MGMQDSEEDQGMRDENDLPDDEIMAMWEQAEVAELIETSVRLGTSPWGVTSSTAPEGITVFSSVTYPRYFDARSRIHPPSQGTETRTAVERESE
jgi:hypothetical protein